MTDEYLLTLTRERSQKLARLAEDSGYQDDPQYLSDMIDRIIDQRYEQMELLR